MAYNQDYIKKLIEDLISRFLADGIVKNVREIGDGYCYDFSNEIISLIPKEMNARIAYTEDYWKRRILDDGTPDPDEAEMFEMDIKLLREQGVWLPDDIPDEDLTFLLGQATHAWIVFDNRHYDTTAPEGKHHFTQMPFFADQIKGYLEDVQKGTL